MLRRAAQVALRCRAASGHSPLAARGSRGLASGPNAFLQVHAARQASRGAGSSVGGIQPAAVQAFSRASTAGAVPTAASWGIARTFVAAAPRGAHSAAVAAARGVRRVASEAGGSGGGSGMAGAFGKLKGMVPSGVSGVKASVEDAASQVAKKARIPPQAKDALLAARKFAGKAPTYKDASKLISLQLEAFWQNNRRPLVVASLMVASVVLWRVLFGVASTFVNLSETFAELGFLALGVASAMFAFMYIRARNTIDPDRLYHLAFQQLRNHPGVLELMGHPLVGTDVRAYVMSGGGIKVNLRKRLRPKWGRERAHLLFPLRGAERRGIVSAVAKRKAGQYHFKMLAVDVPAAAGGNTRIFLVGDQAEYDRGGVISELRDPLLNALAGEPAFEEADEAEEEAEEEEERAEKASRRPKPLGEGGGMYGYEKVLDIFGRARAWTAGAGAAWRGGGGGGGGAGAQVPPGGEKPV